VRVFLSSTYLDLKKYRDLVAEAIARLGNSTSRMEIFGARPEAPPFACLHEVEQCDLFVRIYAHRYGYVPPGQVVSITEEEYRYAKSLGKSIFAILGRGTSLATEAY